MSTVRSGVTDLGADIQTSLSGASVAAVGTLGANMFEYALRYYSQDQFDAAAPNYEGLSQATLASRYAQFVTNFETSLASGHQSASGMWMYAIALVSAGLDANGYPVPQGLPGLQDLDTQYSAQFN